MLLAERIRAACRSAGPGAHRPVGVGLGDVTYGLDVPAEEEVEAWAREEARRAPLSVLTEERGWSHLGPARAAPGGVCDLATFDHGGPRIAVDPVDGTRPLMTDMRSAWTVVSFAPPGPAEPRLADVSYGLVSELPDSRAGRFRRLHARRGAGATIELWDLDGALVDRRPLEVDADGRVDHGFFSFFRFSPDLRPAIARVEESFFERLAAAEGASVEHCYDDQYVANAGQLVLLAVGAYRFSCDLRAALAARLDRPAITAHPYDLAGAVLVAQEAGCVVEDPAGGPLDFPIDARAAVGYAGYANAATHARLAPHLRTALAERGAD